MRVRVLLPALGFQTGEQMLSQTNLLNAIEDDLKVCRNAEHASDDIQGKDRQKLEIATLTRHVQMTHEAGDDQTELEKVVRSLEKSLVVGRYQRWRDRATVSEPVMRD